MIQLPIPSEFLPAAQVMALFAAAVVVFLVFKATFNATRLPYKKKEYLFTKAELVFYNALRQAVKDSGCRIFAKVRLADLIYIPGGVKDWNKYWNKIHSKHIDYILCHGSNIKPILAIELDDSSHLRKDRIRRDIFVNNALECAGLTLMRIQVKSSYNVEELRKRIEAIIEKQV